MRYLTTLGLAAITLLGLSVTANADDQRLDQAAAGQFAQLALSCLEQEYPNKIAHVMDGDDDVAPPRLLTPAFYGCFDWHSAVHGHWMLVRLARLYPETDFADQALNKLGNNLTEQNLLAEAAYMAHPSRSGFERPYGLAWLLALVQELDEWDHPKANQWREWLRPAEDITVRRLQEWIPKLHYPVRVGEHSQTAFAFGLVYDYAEQVGDQATIAMLDDAAERFYIDDVACPLAYEPSGHDFLSPCLAEADFMRRVMQPERFAEWLTAFMPTVGGANWLPVAVVTDREDGKLAHIDGLNLSRAWMLEGIAGGLPDNDPRREALARSAAAHTQAGLSGVSDEHYAGSHWLASFAVYLQTRRGIHGR